MRAIVLDCKGGKASLLLEDGTTAYRRMRCSPGDYVEVPDNDNITRMTGVMKTVAAMLVLVLGLGSYYSSVIMEYSFVSVDVNPSIEFSLNRRDRVVKVEALNKDASVIVEDLNKEDISGKTLYEAMEITIESLIREGYMRPDEAYMLLDVVSQNEEHGRELTKILNDYLQEKDKKPENTIKYAVVRSSLKARAEARRMNLSSGRYERMVEAYGAADVDDNAVAEYKKKPVKEMVDPQSETLISADNKPNPDKADKDKDNKNKQDQKDQQPEKTDPVKSSGSVEGIPVEGTEQTASSTDTSGGSSGGSGSGSSGGSSGGSSSSSNDSYDEGDKYDGSEEICEPDTESFDEASDPSQEAIEIIEEVDPKPEPEESSGEDGQGDDGPDDSYGGDGL